MTSFPGFNPNGECPLCRTNKDKPTLLVPIFGIENEGNLVECQQIHVDCVHKLVTIFLVEFRP